MVIKKSFRNIYLFICALIYFFNFTSSYGARNYVKYVVGPWPGGLGVCLHAVLNHIVHCEKNNKTPVVYWGPNSLYYNSAGFNGSKNVWEYYFEPVSNLSYQKGDYINYFQDRDFGVFNYGNTVESMRYQAHNLIKKYIKIKPVVQNKIDHFYNSNMIGKKTIGIHVRGTDKHIEELPVDPARIVEEALKYADEDTQFLIASDDQRLMNAILHLLNGRKVIYYECHRSQDGSPLHINRKPSYAQLGEDVVVEMSLLAKCDNFIHTRSSVSAIVLYLNPNLFHICLT